MGAVETWERVVVGLVVVAAVGFLSLYVLLCVKNNNRRRR